MLTSLQREEATLKAPKVFFTVLQRGPLFEAGTAIVNVRCGAKNKKEYLMQAQVRITVYVVFLLVVSLFGPNVTTAEALSVDQLLTPITYTTQPGNTEGQPVNAPAFMDQSGTDNNSKVPASPALQTAMLFQSTPTYYVSPSGSDVNSGTFGQPWRTIQKAASTVASGSTVIVTAGSYAELISVGKSNICRRQSGDERVLCQRQ
ncbi:MAG: hypothetical protein HZB19_16375 [Chloroflexi bacterium]|nr:hypothetical protein [Chloroflexota bacterium]